jgi:hypothetical protein
MTLILFFALQICDLLTTLVFLHRGVAEASPLIREAFRLASSPAVGLTAIKLAGCGLAFYSWRSGRTRLLRAANVFFGLCVCWNLAAIAAS